MANLPPMNAPRARALPLPGGFFRPEWSADGMIWRPVVCGSGQQFKRQAALPSEAEAARVAQAFVDALSPV